MSIVQYPIPDGYPGTVETIRQMHRLTAEGVQDDRIVRLAREIVLGVPGKNYHAEAATVLRWVQANIKYVRDPWHPKGLERLQHPAITIWETLSGDCDELSVVFSALCAAIGFPWGFRTCGNDPIFVRRYAHVYSLVRIGEQWLAADPSFVDSVLGWEPPMSDADAHPLRIQPGRAASREDWFP